MSSDLKVLEGVRSRALARCLKERGLGLEHEDIDARPDLIENPPPGWPEEAAMPPKVAQAIAAAKADVRRSGEPHRIEVEVGTLEAPRRFELRISPDIDENGRVAGLFTILVDVTESRQRERAMKNLLRELSHRSKNLLAIVQSVAMQTAHYSGNTAEFLEKFRGRLQALASTQDLVTESNWRGSFFRELVAGQLARLGPGLAGGVEVSGSNPMLGPNAALYVGLAIHELASNALVHGRLGEEDNGIAITANLGPGTGKGRLLTIDWREPAARAGTQGEPRFGTLVLERIVPLSVGGSAAYVPTPTGITYRLTVPSEQFEA